MMAQSEDSGAYSLESKPKFNSLTSNQPLNLDHRKMISSISEGDFTSHDLNKDFDAVVIYSEEDLEMATNIVDEINKLQLGDNMARAQLYDLVDITSIQKFDQIKAVLEKSTYVFVLCTHNYCKDAETRYMGDECLMKSIYNTDNKQHWQVVPILDCEEKLNNIPLGLNSLQPIKWKTQHGVTRMRKLIEQAPNRRFYRSQSMTAISSKSLMRGISNPSIVDSRVDSLPSSIASTSQGKKSEDELTENFSALSIVSKLKTSQEEESTGDRDDGTEKSFVSARSSLQRTTYEYEDRSAISFISSTKSTSLEEKTKGEREDGMADSDISSLESTSVEEKTTDEREDGMADCSIASKKNTSQEEKTTDEREDGMADFSIASKKNTSLEEKTTDEREDGMSDSAISSLESTSQEKTTGEREDGMADYSIASKKNTSLEEKITDECEDGMADYSIASKKNTSLEEKTTDECEDGMADYSIASKKNTSLEEKTTDECVDGMSDSAISSLESTSQEEKTTGEREDSMAYYSIASKKNTSLEEKITDECEDGMADSSIASTKSTSLEEMPVKETISDQQETQSNSSKKGRSKFPCNLS